MSIFLLIAALAAIVVLLCVWSFWIAPRLGAQRLDTAQRSAMFALHTITSLAILSAGILYLDEQQWTPRLGVELKTDTRLVPGSNPKAAVVQLTVAITNKTETSQNVNFIEVSAAGIRGPVRPDPKLPENILATQFYRYLISRPSEVGPDETHSEFVEIPVPCDWSLVRVDVKVPRPPARRDRFGVVYERKQLVAVSDVCSPSAAGTMDSSRAGGR